MATKKISTQSRKSVSMSGVLFKELKAHCEAKKKSMSEVVESQLRQFLKMPARELPAKAIKPVAAFVPVVKKKSEPIVLVEEKPKRVQFPSPPKTDLFGTFTTKVALPAPSTKKTLLPTLSAPKSDPPLPPSAKPKSDPPSLPVVAGQKSSNIVMF